MGLKKTLQACEYKSGDSISSFSSVTGAVDSSGTTEDMSDAPYTLTYKAYDSAGNTNSQEAVETRQVYVVDTTSPTAAHTCSSV